MEQYWSEIITFLVTLGSTYGMMTTQIKNQKAEIEEIKAQLTEYQKDHDLLIRVDTKVDSINDSIKELKDLIKDKKE
jgi:tRNA(Ser,Leu) C12 N-acetylase TAN1